MNTTKATVTTTGAANGVTHTPNGTHARGLVSISGTFTGATLVVEKLPFGGTVWLPVNLLNEQTLVRSSTGGPSNSTTTSYAFDCAGAQRVRAYPSAGSGLTAVVEVTTGTTDEMGGPIQVNTTAVSGPARFADAVTSSSATGGIGYATGAGGTVTQATNKSTGVTLNTVTGAITMNNAALAASAIVSFTVTNSTVAATDAVVVNHASAGTAGSYAVYANAIGAGSFAVTVQNISGGSLSEAIVLRFAVVKGVSA